MYNKRRFKLLKMADFEVGSYKKVPGYPYFVLLDDVTLRQSHRIM